MMMMMMMMMMYCNLITSLAGIRQYVLNYGLSKHCCIMTRLSKIHSAGEWWRQFYFYWVGNQSQWSLDAAIMQSETLSSAQQRLIETERRQRQITLYSCSRTVASMETRVNIDAKSMDYCRNILKCREMNVHINCRLASSDGIDISRYVASLMSFSAELIL